MCNDKDVVEADVPMFSNNVCVKLIDPDLNCVADFFHSLTDDNTGCLIISETEQVDHLGFFDEGVIILGFETAKQPAIDWYKTLIDNIKSNGFKIANSHIEYVSLEVTDTGCVRYSEQNGFKETLTKDQVTWEQKVKEWF